MSKKEKEAIEVEEELLVDEVQEPSTDNEMAVSFKDLSKGDLWDYQENDIFRMLKRAEKDIDFFETYTHYLSMIKSAFLMEKFDPEKELQIISLKKQGYKTDVIKVENTSIGVAIRKKAIKKVTDLSYENIRHITAAKLLDVISNNFGGGWDSLSQSIKDVIESGFDISTNTLPTDRMHKAGGMYEKKVADGFDVLEVPKGTWTEAIFAKVKPLNEVPRVTTTKMTLEGDETDEEGDIIIEEDNEIDEFAHEIDMTDEDVNDMTEENYRTTFDISTDDISDEDDLDLDD